MTQIIGFAGKKQSGKNVSCNFVMMMKMKQLGISERIRVNNTTGELEFQDILGERLNGWFTLNSVNMESLYNSVGPFCKIYGLADALKDIAINVLGLPRDKVYGTDEDKMSETHLRWENMPGVTTEVTPQDPIDKEIAGRLGRYYEKVLSGIVYHEPGPMTIREVLQYMGTEIFRKMYEHVWVDTLLRRIEEDAPEIALICDARFDNELILLKNRGAIILGLLRDIFQSKDTHASEQINFDLCSAVIDNRERTIPEQCEAIYNMLVKLKCKHIPQMIIG